MIQVINKQGSIKGVGATGVAGDSAYQVWLDDGNVGTITDFLNSLIGPVGPSGAYTIVNQTAATYNVVATSATLVILCDTTSNAITINLPTAIGNTATIVVKKINLGSNAVTVNADGSETIDDGLTAVINVQYVSISLVSDGTNWLII